VQFGVVVSPLTSARKGVWAGQQSRDLERICFHVLAEYARHAGQLDIAVELAGSG
jgi:hypothetical protein